MNISDNIKNKILLSDYIKSGSRKISTKRIRINPCPLCGGNDCFDIIPSGAKGNQHEIFDCRQCRSTGTIIDFYCMEQKLNSKDNNDLKRAIKELCDIGSINNGNDNKNSLQGDIEPKKDITVIQKPEYDFSYVADKLHHQLLKDEQALKYFLDRGLSIETIKKFKLGYEPNGINETFKSYEEIKLKYDNLAQCYTYYIPMYENGKCSYILPRLNKNILDDKINNKELYKIDKEGKERKYPKTMNLSGVPTVLYNFDEAMKSDTVFICEGWCDALSLEDLGYKAISLNSVSNINAFVRKLEEVQDYKSKYYIIAFDNDKTGLEAIKTLSDKLTELKCNIKQLYLTGDNIKDINDLFIKDHDKLISLTKNILNEIKEEKENVLYKNSCYGYLNNILEKFKANKDRKLISTGYKKLDEILGGGIYNNLYVLGGISGLGKTALALNITENIAKENKDVLFISLELSREELMARSISRFVREEAQGKPDNPFFYPSYTEIRNGNFDFQYESIQKGLNKYAEASKNIFVQEANFNYDTEKIRQDIINHKITRGSYPVLVVDYLQVLPCLKDYSDEKRNIDFNITELKRISRDFDIPVIVLCSLNRAYYKKQVDFEAFKSSGSIEYTCDVALGLQYSIMDDNNFSEEDIENAKKKPIKDIQVVVLKNRNGAILTKSNFKYEARYNYFKEVK